MTSEMQIRVLSGKTYVPTESSQMLFYDIVRVQMGYLPCLVCARLV